MRPPSFCCFLCLASFIFPWLPWNHSSHVQHNLHSSQLSIPTVTHHPSCAPHLSASHSCSVCMCVVCSVKMWPFRSSEMIPSPFWLKRLFFQGVLVLGYTVFNASQGPDAQDCFWQRGFNTNGIVGCRGTDGFKMTHEPFGVEKQHLLTPNQKKLSEW